MRSFIEFWIWIFEIEDLWVKGGKRVFLHLGLFVLSYLV